jgi:hypothetical protein
LSESSADVHLGPWRSLEEVEFATLEWVDWFNHRRLLEPIGDIAPAEFEAMYCESQDAPESPEKPGRFKQARVGRIGPVFSTTDTRPSDN